MAEITAALVKELREKTGAGMMDCKRALGETQGDLEGAVDWLRKKGIAAAAKKASRVAAEGLVATAVKGKAGALVEVNAETDFVARNDTFQAFVRTVAELALAGTDDVEALRGKAYPGTGRTVAEELTHMIATVGENMALRRVARLEVGEGAVVSYMHNALAPGLGKIGVLVALESKAGGEAIAAAGRPLAMHVAAAQPRFLDVAAVDAATLARERSVLMEQPDMRGKPEAIVAKIVEGRLRKFYEEVVLLEQKYVLDPESTVKKAIEGMAKETGAPVKVAGFARFALGEGIDKEAKE